MTSLTLDIRRIDATLEGSLAALFRQIKESKDDYYFHPHPFDDETAHWIASYSGKDLYYAAIDTEDQRILGYGMLRGWDAGYEIPSLGIVICREARGRGLSKPLMHFLHNAARARGCSRIRLKVDRNNHVALKLYEYLGYRFEGEEGGQLVGMMDL